MNPQDQLDAEVLFEKKHEESFEKCKLSFVSKSSLTGGIVAIVIALLGISGGIIGSCVSNAREAGEQNVKIFNLEKTQGEILTTVNKVSDATAARQQEILSALNDLKRVNGKKSDK
jgi:hypothetical protein